MDIKNSEEIRQAKSSQNGGGIWGISERREKKIVMGKETETLIQYAQADFSKRMHLFLQFPDLRDAFQEIERKDLATRRASPSSMKQHDRGKCSRLLSFHSRIIKIKIRQKAPG